MNKNILIVLIGGFVVAVLVAMLVQMSLGGGKKKEEDVILLSVLVAADDIAVGHELEADDLAWKKWPENIIFPGAIVRDGDEAPIDAISGKTVRSIKEGEPVHMSAVVEEEGGFLSAKIEHGMRAVGINVRKHIISDRLITPGDIVDVIVTYRVRVNSRENPEVRTLINRYASETILENVRILAVDSNTSVSREGDDDGKKKKKKTKSAKKATVTLEVTQEGAEQLALAMEMGDISFAARGIAKEPEAADDNMTTDVHMSRVLTDLSELTTGGAGGAVRVYSGSTMEEVRPRHLKAETGGVDFSVQERPADVVSPIYRLPAAPSAESIEE